LDYSLLYFWRSQSGVEVDVLPETAKSYVAVELKNGTRWDKRFNHSLHRLSGELDGKMVSCFGVYMGRENSPSMMSGYCRQLNFYGVYGAGR
jgi:hypothetical protein